ncbi:MAG: hypothetical protein REI09_14130 [Candidatus Dactylopiibacterium sp.]|nr:hypothetical protein [Candidatus Dactylopiibacterium sp.]
MMFSSRRDTGLPPWNLASLPGHAVAVRLAAGPVGMRARLARIEIVEGPEPHLARLERLAARLGLRREAVRLLLESGSYQFVQSELPQVPLDELRTALRWRVKDMLSHPVEDVTLDVVMSPEAEVRPASAYVVAAPNALLRERMLMLRPWNASVDIIDVPEMAQRNLADALEEPGRATAVLAITPAGCLLTASQAGELFFVRHFDLSCRSLNSSPAVRRDQFDRLVLELQRSFDVLERQQSARAVSALWVAPFAHAAELHGLLVESLYQPVKLLTLDALFDVDDCPLPPAPDHQAAILHALGLSLRDQEIRA